MDAKVIWKAKRDGAAGAATLLRAGLDAITHLAEELFAGSIRWRARQAGRRLGAAWKNAQTAGSARHWAVTIFGGAKELHCYADI
jgi:dihydroxy-acid dehydratase